MAGDDSLLSIEPPIPEDCCDQLMNSKDGCNESKTSNCTPIKIPGVCSTPVACSGLKCKVNQLESLNDRQLLSLACLSGLSQCQSDSLPCFVERINKIFSGVTPGDTASWPERKDLLFKELKRVRFSEQEFVKYIQFDHTIPYTRNLLATDGVNYTLLILCWTPGYESKIHNHPCDGCFVRGIKGVVKESRYSIHPETDEIRLDKVGTCEAGDVTYMDDYEGLHKIGNPSFIHGAVTLHLYTPPYFKCKVWTDSELKISKAIEGCSMHYSEYGVRQAKMKETDLACYI